MNDITNMYSRDSTFKSSRIKSFINIHVVTVDWLRDCLLQEKKISPEGYKPQAAGANGYQYIKTDDQSRR